MRKFSFALFVIIVALMGAACEQGDEVAVTRMGAPATVAPAGGEQPQPMPTVAPELLGRGQLWLGNGDTLHGAPPFEATLTARYFEGPGGLPAPCAQLQWDFGDGRQQETSCAVEPNARPFEWQVRHHYEEPGIYHAAVRMALADGTLIEGEKSQTVLAATAQPSSLRETALRWLGWVLLLTALGAAVSGVALLRERRQLWAGAALALFLISFVPPFSYVPDPLGVVLAVTGGYEDDLRLPFANRFLIAGDATRPLRPTLDALIGQTGLDPLDPHAPLARYDFLKVVRGRYQTMVQVRFSYEGGEQRTYAVPLRQPSGPLGFYACCWRYDGLGRLRTEHRALTPAPTVSAGELPIGAPQRVAGPAEPSSFAQEWFGAAANPLAPRLAWSPDGRALATTMVSDSAVALWVTDVVQGQSWQVADSVWSYAWTPDSQGLIYSVVEMGGPGDRGHLLLQIWRVSRDGSAPEHLLALRRGESGFPGSNEQGLWFVRDGALWLMPWDGGEAGLRQLTALPDIELDMRRGPVQVQPSADGQRVAYTCSAGLCLIDAGGGNAVVAAADPRQIALSWGANGEQLAAVFWGYPGDGSAPTVLRLFARDGELLAAIPVAPEGMAEAPAWLPDGQSALLQTFPLDGRRIISVDLAAGTALDLSRPRWDAFFALHPDGERLLLSNGRGGYWLAPYDG